MPGRANTAFIAPALPLGAAAARALAPARPARRPPPRRRRRARLVSSTAPAEPTPPALTADVDHVALSCRDALAAAQWYARVLGFAPVDFEAYRAGTRPFPSVRLSPACILDFFTRPQSAPAATGGGGGGLDHLCFAVKSRAELRGVIERLTAAGHAPADPVPAPRSGARGTGYSVYASDVCGNTVEFRTYEPLDA